jgi:hypothetical protein
VTAHLSAQPSIRLASSGGRRLRQRLLSIALLTLACGAPDLGSDGAGGGTGSSAVPITCTPTADTWATFGEAFFSSTCAGCHGTLADQGTVNGLTRTLASAMSTGAMPQGDRLAAADKARVLASLACGAP